MATGEMTLFVSRSHHDGDEAKDEGGQADGQEHEDDGQDEEDDLPPREARQLLQGDKGEPDGEHLNPPGQTEKLHHNAVDGIHIGRIDLRHQQFGEAEVRDVGALAEEDVEKARQDEEHGQGVDVGETLHKVHEQQAILTGLLVDLLHFGRHLGCLSVFEGFGEPLPNLFARLLEIVLHPDVHAALNEQRERCQQEEEFEGREIGHLHAREVVANHVAWAQYQVANAAEHAPVANAPDVKEQQKGFLKRIAADLGRLPTPRTVVALEAGAAGGALMLFL